jgi:hypothetical protein
MLTNDKMMHQDFLYLLFGTHTHRPFLCDHHIVVGEHFLPLLHLCHSVCYCVNSPRAKSWISRIIHRNASRPPSSPQLTLCSSFRLVRSGRSIAQGSPPLHGKVSQRLSRSSGGGWLKLLRRAGQNTLLVSLAAYALYIQFQRRG